MNIDANQIRTELDQLVEAHPEWPRHLIQQAYTAINARRYAKLDAVLAELDRLSRPS